MHRSREHWVDEVIFMNSWNLEIDLLGLHHATPWYYNSCYTCSTHVEPPYPILCRCVHYYCSHTMVLVRHTSINTIKFILYTLKITKFTRYHTTSTCTPVTYFVQSPNLAACRHARTFHPYSNPTPHTPHTTLISPPLCTSLLLLIASINLSPTTPFLICTRTTEPTPHTDNDAFLLPSKTKL